MSEPARDDAGNAPDQTNSARPAVQELYGRLMGLRWSEIPADIRHRAARLVADCLAAAYAGIPTPTARIAADYAATVMPGDDALAWFDERRLSIEGAAFANSVLANALDFDDGHRLSKGHPGAVIVPAAVALAEHVGSSVEELMTAIVLGYEISIRASIAQHATRVEYHATGSWGAIGVASVATRLLGLSYEQFEDAIGIAEYHAPISLIMRSVDEPAMTKDAIGWGALVGVSSARLAAAGFTGTRAEVLLAPDFATVGSVWRIDETYVKPYPSCRWGHASVRGAVGLRPQLGSREISAVTIRTFAAAAALSQELPTSVERAQYSLKWPVATALVTGGYVVDDVVDGVDDPAVLAVFDRTTVAVDDKMDAAFPARRLAAVDVELSDGTVLSSDALEAFGEPGDSEWDAVVVGKVERYLGRRPIDGLATPSTATARFATRDELADALCFAFVRAQ
jgi:2-methylcitrate dehydratase PrpD